MKEESSIGKISPRVELESIRNYMTPYHQAKALFDLLAERPASANISHSTMPTWDEHKAFISSCPYHRWFLIVADDRYVGACYHGHNNELGIAILQQYQRRGIARIALQMLMEHPPKPALPGSRPGHYVANIAPGNVASMRLFRALGFGDYQVTLAKRS